MRVELLYFDSCPSWRTAEQRLAAALLSLGFVDVPIVRVRVETLSQPEMLRFTGSPTILINGMDPFSVEDAPIGLACRIYETPGGFVGAPSMSQLIEALASRR